MANPIPVVALMYDFDKTLCTKDMQEYGFIPAVRMTPDAFWEAADRLAVGERMDRILAYMYLMLEQSKRVGAEITRRAFVEHGRSLELYPGVTDWFERTRVFGLAHGAIVEHYVISSGLREIIEGSSIFHEFKEVFASEFLYDKQGLACWPRNAVNYTTKTQYLFRISKGILDVTQHDNLNRHISPDERPVPWRNMIYIGDGLTDVPCMELVKSNGGCSIAVYQPGQRSKVEDLLRDKRVDFVFSADYSPESDLTRVVQATIVRLASADALVRESRRQYLEAMNRRD
ncbi:MAG: HAD family hydrolase [Anaerolineae bacterium]